MITEFKKLNESIKIRCTNIEQSERLLSYLELFGYKWRSGLLPTSLNYWNNNALIVLSGKEIHMMARGLSRDYVYSSEIMSGKLENLIEEEDRKEKEKSERDKVRRESLKDIDPFGEEDWDL